MVMLISQLGDVVPLPPPPGDMPPPPKELKTPLGRIISLGGSFMGYKEKLYFFGDMRHKGVDHFKGRERYCWL